MFNNWSLEGQGISNDLTTETIGFDINGKKFILIVFRTSAYVSENLGSVLLPVSLLSTAMFARGYITYAVEDLYLRYTVLSITNNRLSLNFTTNFSQAVGVVFSI